MGVLERGEGACWGARAMLTGLDPHPAPTPLNNSVSISGTRLPCIPMITTGQNIQFFIFYELHCIKYKIFNYKKKTVVNDRKKNLRKNF